MLSKLKNLRENKGYTQNQIAKLLQVSIRQYQRYESGAQEPTVSTAMQLSRIYNTNVESIFTP